MASSDKNRVASGILVAFTLYGLLSQSFFTCVASGIVLVIIVNRLWIQYLPPVLIYLFAYQFLQIFGAVLYSDFKGQPIDVVYDSPDLSYLIIVTLVQLALMVLYVSSLLKVRTIPDINGLKQAVLKLDTRKIIICYLISAFIFPVLITVTYSISSLNQLIQSFAVIKKVFLMMLLFIAFLTKNKYRTTIILIFVAEFILSFVSYFSNFKDIFVYVIMVYLTVNPNVKSKTILRLVPVIAALILLLVFWSSVKTGYRSFLNNDSRQQEVSVEKSEALDYILDRATGYNLDSLAVGEEILLFRAQYMVQYAKVYSRVPSIIPYANGKNLMGTASFLLIPRSFVDKKAILDPSTKTTYYTGQAYANASQGTSISMGYFCDLYIDYGLWLMIIPLLVITFIIGRSSGYILNYGKYNIIFTYSLFIGLCLSLGTFESDIIFYLGSIRNYAVVVILGNMFIFPRIMKFISLE